MGIELEPDGVNFAISNLDYLAKTQFLSRNPEYSTDLVPGSTISIKHH